MDSITCSHCQVVTGDTDAERVGWFEVKAFYPLNVGGMMRGMKWDFCSKNCMGKHFFNISATKEDDELLLSAIQKAWDEA